MTGRKRCPVCRRMGIPATAAECILCRADEEESVGARLVTERRPVTEVAADPNSCRSGTAGLIAAIAGAPYDISGRQETFLAALLDHPNRTLAATAAGINYHTARKYLADPLFIRARQESLRLLREQHWDRLTFLTDKALDALDLALDDEDMSIRLKAAVEVFKRTLPEKLEVEGARGSGDIKITEIVVQLPQSGEVTNHRDAESTEGEVIQGELADSEELPTGLVRNEQGRVVWAGLEVVVEGEG